MSRPLSEVSLLYVEDDADVRDELVEYLELKVKKLYVGEDGKQGLELYQNHKPDLVVTDIKMPEMNGLQMSREIRKINPKALIVITTAYKDTEFFLEAIDIGINQFVTKPIILEKLMVSINKCLDLMDITL